MKHSATIYDFVRPDHRLSDDWPVFELMNRRLVTGVMEELGSRFRFDDVWFGGVGDVTKRPDDAPVVDFSRTERRALDLLVEALCTALTDVWSDLESISPALLRCSKREQLRRRVT